MRNGYKDTLTIERINNNKGYSPENCKWIPFEEQAKNRRTTIWIDYKGEKLCLSDFCKKTNNSYTKMIQRFRAKKLKKEKPTDYRILLQVDTEVIK